MTEQHPTLLFASLAFILILGSWALNPIEANGLSYADQFSFWGLPNGKNVISCFSLLALGVYGLTCRPRFDLGREVLVGLALACVGCFFLGLFGVWHHLEPQVISRWAVHLALSLCVMNAGFALVAAQLPLKGTWWLFGLCQFIAIFNASFEYLFNDKRFLLMSQAFLAVLILFSMLRVRRLSYANHLYYSLFLFMLAFISNYFDHEILQGSQYIISGHSLQNLFWSIAGFFLLRFLIVIKPSDLVTVQANAE